ncbi:hypothetical protein HPHPH18_1153 [Helicobacter pylori Hp H-18]|nr:hypothetical protein HPHPH18_1153 [Helicobacter pylori Hp H-18]
MGVNPTIGSFDRNFRLFLKCELKRVRSKPNRRKLKTLKDIF